MSKLREFIVAENERSDKNFEINCVLNDNTIYIQPDDQNNYLFGSPRKYRILKQDGEIVMRLSSDTEHTAKNYVMNMLYKLYKNAKEGNDTVAAHAELLDLYTDKPRYRTDLENDLFTVYQYVQSISDKKDRCDKSFKLLKMLKTKYRKKIHANSNRQRSSKVRADGE